MYQVAGKQCNFTYKIQQNISHHIGWQLIFEVLCGPFTSPTDTNLYNTREPFSVYKLLRLCLSMKGEVMCGWAINSNTCADS